MRKRILIAMGSNVGDSAGTFRWALSEISKFSELGRTSFLYRSKPMYVEDQADFYNAVCEIRSHLPPLSLLDQLKRVEIQAGRDVTAMRYGPRQLDLDILFYGNEVINSERLVVPHPKMSDRDFVLRPLRDLDTDCSLAVDGRPLKEVLEDLDPATACQMALPLPQRGLDFLWGKRTICMGIVNATPDSFSDGGENMTVANALQTAESFIAAGCEILDVGGQSTRPGAEEIGPEAEIQRVVPIISAVRKRFPKNVAISIDTFHASVARAAVECGADIINDVSGGRRDPEMFTAISELKVPVILMHSRGDSRTMTNMTNYNDLVKDVCSELSEQVEKAMDEGVPRWDIILDPGFGFAKNGFQNLELLRNLKDFKSASGNFPMLTGLSRKSFIGHITGKKFAAERDFGTAAAVTLCTVGGSDITRFHNPDIADTVAVASAVVRV